MKTKTATRIKDVRLCTDKDGNEAIYVNGTIRFSAETIYQCEVARHCGRGVLKIKHHSVESFDNESWPEKFSNLKLID